MIVEVHAMSRGGCTPFSPPGVSCSATSFPSRMEKVESPATMEERTCSALTVIEIELLGVEEKSQPIHCHREWRKRLGHIHLHKHCWKGSGTEFLRCIFFSPLASEISSLFFPKICGALSASWWFNRRHWVLGLWKTWSARLVIDIDTPTLGTTY